MSFFLSCPYFSIAAIPLVFLGRSIGLSVTSTAKVLPPSRASSCAFFLQHGTFRFGSTPFRPTGSCRKQNRRQFGIHGQERALFSVFTQIQSRQHWSAKRTWSPRVSLGRLPLFLRRDSRFSVTTFFILRKTSFFAPKSCLQSSSFWGSACCQRSILVLLVGLKEPQHSTKSQLSQCQFA